MAVFALQFKDENKLRNQQSRSQGSELLRKQEV